MGEEGELKKIEDVLNQRKRYLRGNNEFTRRFYDSHYLWTGHISDEPPEQWYYQIPFNALLNLLEEAKKEFPKIALGNEVVDLETIIDLCEWYVKWFGGGSQ